MISGRPDTGGQDAHMKETIAGKSGAAGAVGAGEVGVESDDRRGSSVAEQLIRKQLFVACRGDPNSAVMRPMGALTHANHRVGGPAFFPKLS